MLVQRCEPQGRCFTNFHYYCYNCCCGRTKHRGWASPRPEFSSTASPPPPQTQRAPTTWRTWKLGRTRSASPPTTSSFRRAQSRSRRTHHSCPTLLPQSKLPCRGIFTYYWFVGYFYRNLFARHWCHRVSCLAMVFLHIIGMVAIFIETSLPDIDATE